MPRRSAGRKRATQVKIKHIVNCLYQIEIWAQALRKALQNLDQDLPVPLTRTLSDTLPNVPRLHSGCPPPD